MPECKSLKYLVFAKAMSLFIGMRTPDVMHVNGFSEVTILLNLHGMSGLY